MNESVCFVMVCFTPGDAHRLSAKLGEFIARPLSEEERARQIKRVEESYDWEKIAAKTLGVYGKAIGKF